MYTYGYVESKRYKECMREIIGTNNEHKIGQRWYKIVSSKNNRMHGTSNRTHAINVGKIVYKSETTHIQAERISLRINETRDELP